MQAGLVARPAVDGAERAAAAVAAAVVATAG